MEVIIKYQTRWGQVLLTFGGVIVGGVLVGMLVGKLLIAIPEKSDKPVISIPTYIEETFIKSDGTPCTIIRIRHNTGSFAVTCDYDAIPYSNPDKINETEI